MLSPSPEDEFFVFVLSWFWLVHVRANAFLGIRVGLVECREEGITHILRDFDPLATVAVEIVLQGQIKVLVPLLK